MARTILFNINAFDNGYFESEIFNRSNRAAVKSQQLFCNHYADEYEYRLFTYEDDLVIEAKKEFADYIKICEQEGKYNYAVDAIRMYMLLHLENSIYLDDDVYIYNYEKTHAFFHSLQGQFIVNKRFYCIVNMGPGDDIKRMYEYIQNLKEPRDDAYIYETLNPRMVEYSKGAGLFHFAMHRDTSFEVIDTIHSDYEFDPSGYRMRFAGCSNTDEERLPVIFHEFFPECFKRSYDKKKSYYFLVIADTSYGTFFSKKKLLTAGTEVVVLYIDVNEFENLDTFIQEMTK